MRREKLYLPGGELILVVTEVDRSRYRRKESCELAGERGKGTVWPWYSCTPDWPGRLSLVGARLVMAGAVGVHSRRSWVVGPICDADVVIVNFDAELWIWDARRADSWTFVSLPADVSEEIRELTAGGPARGFGSVRVRVTIGGSTWKTSIFPDSAGYVLPIKRAVRTAEALEAGDTASVTVELIDL